MGRCRNKCNCCCKKYKEIKTAQQLLAVVAALDALDALPEIIWIYRADLVGRLWYLDASGSIIDNHTQVPAIELELDDCWYRLPLQLGVVRAQGDFNLAMYRSAYEDETGTLRLERYTTEDGKRVNLADNAAFFTLHDGLAMKLKSGNVDIAANRLVAFPTTAEDLAKLNLAGLTQSQPRFVTVDGSGVIEEFNDFHTGFFTSEYTENWAETYSIVRRNADKYSDPAETVLIRGSTAFLGHEQ